MVYREELEMATNGDIMTHVPIEVPFDLQQLASSTLAKYTHGIKLWHLYHKLQYPKDADNRVKALLKASVRADVPAPLQPKKDAIHLRHLPFLTDRLLQGAKKEKAILDLAITAFWGMARLAELTYQFSTGNPECAESLLTPDVKTKQPGNTTRLVLVLREAKTCNPGIVQKIELKPLDNMLCPVKAVTRCLEEAGGANTLLFGYYNNNSNRIHLTRDSVTRALSKIWSEGDFGRLSGHSSRIGDASLWNALGINSQDICLLGRWIYECYKLYSYV
ncbi:hypothetical protein PSTG_10733 [Puccinia striiformis f. sp. tritici PST-78]|uniref:Tyr recombinase domain-containing protein n=1 Tax=Puccinia striiformis f. sp. tritici PST-78 TaxID=1165861 RepID=A0A0L0V9H9_9BASI|nr:hypothetical protein PSTG_10733 [Puccinia striiformis f. sp. tritici PST-78]